MFICFNTRVLALQNSPDFEVLDGISVVVFRWPLPGDDKGSQGRKAQLKDILGGEGGNDMTD